MKLKKLITKSKFNKSSLFKNQFNLFNSKHRFLQKYSQQFIGNNLLMKGLFIGGSLLTVAIVTVYANNEESKENDKEDKQIEKKKEENKEEPRIYRIVLTGGPCSGKSTAMSKLSDQLISQGFKVFIVPEIPTIMLTGGATYRNTSQQELIHFEDNVLKIQMMMEDSFYDIARSTGKDCVILMDRGVMDIYAYIPSEIWSILLEENKQTNVSLRDRRYDAVIHLVTAAIGAEEWYTTQNNSARMETAEEARMLDKMTLNAWIGHKNLFIVDNSTNFTEKINRVIKSLRGTVGLPKLEENENVFNVISVNLENSSSQCGRLESFEEEEFVLQSNNPDLFPSLIKRGQNGSFVYFYNVKKTDEFGNPITNSRIINAREFITLKTNCHTTPQSKRVTFFEYQNNYFTLETSENGNQILRFKLRKGENKFEIPDFIVLGERIKQEK